jgi:hypothetical protein
LKSRRLFLAGLSSALLSAQTEPGKGRTFASDAQRYADPATEFTVYRLTSPKYESRMTAYYNRGMTGRNTLLFSNDRTGRFELFRADIKSGQTRQLTNAEHLDPGSIAVLANDRGCCYFDGPSLRELSFAALRDREVHRLAEGTERVPGFSVSPDGKRALFVERAGEGYRLRSIDLARGTASTLVEGRDEMSHPMVRPGHSQVMYLRGGTPC